MNEDFISSSIATGIRCPIGGGGGGEPGGGGGGGGVEEPSTVSMMMTGGTYHGWTPLSPSHRWPARPPRHRRPTRLHDQPVGGSRLTTHRAFFLAVSGQSPKMGALPHLYGPSERFKGRPAATVDGLVLT